MSGWSGILIISHSSAQYFSMKFGGEVFHIILYLDCEFGLNWMIRWFLNEFWIWSKSQLWSHVRWSEIITISQAKTQYFSMKFGGEVLHIILYFDCEFGLNWMIRWFLNEFWIWSKSQLWSHVRWSEIITISQAKTQYFSMKFGGEVLHIILYFDCEFCWNLMIRWFLNEFWIWYKSQLWGNVESCGVVWNINYFKVFHSIFFHEILC